MSTIYGHKPKQLFLPFLESTPFPDTSGGVPVELSRFRALVVQIRRDLAVLKEPKAYHPDDAFYLERIRVCRETAKALAKTLGLDGGTRADESLDDSPSEE